MVAENQAKLLRFAIDIADGCSDLGERRHALIGALAELTESDVGHWSWCRASSDSDYLLPIGFIPYRYSDEELHACQQFIVNPIIQSELFRRLDQHRDENRREDGVWSMILSEAAPDIFNNPAHPAMQIMTDVGFVDWMQAGKFEGDSFAVMTLVRKLGRPRFDPHDRLVLDHAFTCIPWLWANPDERVKQESIDQLTPRQRAVTYLLLDGLSRKQIAGRLGISAETVDHHLKAVFKHFEVQSGMELASLFLRNQ